MGQVFHPRFGLYVQLVLLAVLVSLVCGALVWRASTAEPHGVGEAVEQPVPFSHKHHVGDDGIDCRYCHSSVETSAFAGIPPLSTCMTCHSQLYTDTAALKPVVDSWRHGVALHWQRVHQLPDFVYFNHSIHVAKGVACETCHGDVDDMPLMQRAHSLSMEWCLGCHRDPAPNLRPPQDVFRMHWRPPADIEQIRRQLISVLDIHPDTMTDCYVCHR